MGNASFNTDILIIGAGISGLHLSQRLKQGGIKSLLLEKSKGIGGRLATRRIEDLGFDHGTPYLPWSNAVIQILSAYGMENHFHKVSEGIYFKGGMNLLPKKMAQNLDVHREVRATSIESLPQGWRVTSANGSVYDARILVLAMPFPQTKDLLMTCPQVKGDLPEVKYSKKILSLNILDDEAGSVRQNTAELCYQYARGLHPNGAVFYGDDEFSDKHFDLPDDELLQHLHLQTEMKTGFRFKVKKREIKKWRYCLPQTVIDRPFLEVSQNLFVIGDFFSECGIPGAITSAEALSFHLYCP